MSSRRRRARPSCGWERFSTIEQGNRRGRRTRLRPMALRDTWHGLLVYFGLAEDRDAYDEEVEDAGREPEQELESRYRERPNVRRLSSRRRRDDIDDIFADEPSGSERRTATLRPVGGGRPNG